MAKIGIKVSFPVKALSLNLKLTFNREDSGETRNKDFLKRIKVLIFDKDPQTVLRFFLD